ncbi:hypothetical protein DPMN_031875 [Dreissena polymorpha]|uniref:Uncharacterized protein n=1 Tax=Dreissena polymorpha TaxID=45954 RepID=A0A9D4RIE6_DREPO|nr:hypothetical protein DPMN_031875 [Dreissena polymorpha]
MPTSSLQPVLITHINNFRNAYQLSATSTYNTHKQLAPCLPALYNQYVLITHKDNLHHAYQLSTTRTNNTHNHLAPCLPALYNQY